MAQSTLELPFKIHRAELLLEGKGPLDERLIVDSTAPDGVRRSLSIKDWHFQVLNDVSGEGWGRMGAELLRIAFKVENSDLIRGARRDYGYL